MAQATGARGANAAQYKQQLRSEVTWLRKTPIMGNNLYDSIHKQQKQNAYANRPPAPYPPPPSLTTSLTTTTRAHMC